MIEIRGWRAGYPGAFQLGPLDLALPPGATVALVGPNGAGKTTLFKSLTGAIPGNGDLLVDGCDFKPTSPRWLRKLGYLPDSPTEIIEEFTALEYWEFLLAMRRRVIGPQKVEVARKHCSELAQLLNLDYSNRSVIANYSLGMRKKTQLVATLMFRPELLILDEPRNGLDPYGIEAMIEAVATAAQEGATVLVASHDLDWCFTQCHEFIGIGQGQQQIWGRVRDFPTSTHFKKAILGALR